MLVVHILTYWYYTVQYETTIYPKFSSLCAF